MRLHEVGKGDPPWRGTVQLTSEQRRLLLAIPQVTERLLAYCWRTVEIFAWYVRHGNPDAATAEDRAREFAECSERARTARYFAAWLKADDSAAFALGTRTISEDNPDAAEWQWLNDNSAALIAALEELAQSEEVTSAYARPRRGPKTDPVEDEFIHTMSCDWYGVLRKAPTTGEHSSFVRLVEQLSAICGRPVTRQKIRTVLKRNKEECDRLGG